jgi:hypothetical protein
MDATSIKEPSMQDEPKKQPQNSTEPETRKKEDAPKEIGGPKGPEPTRYGDWEVNGRTSDF